MPKDKAVRLSLLLYARALHWLGLGMNGLTRLLYQLNRGALKTALFFIRWSNWSAAHATNLLAESLAAYEEISRLRGEPRPNVRKESGHAQP